MITVRSLRDAGNKPRVHNNGFIQLDVTDDVRLHVWGDPRIPRQKTYTPIHDHVFKLKSRILVGRLINLRYDIIPTQYGDYTIYQAECRYGHDTELKPTEIKCCVSTRYAELIQVNTRNREYYMPACEFHETVATGPAASLIKKEQSAFFETAKPRVLVPLNSEPDNEFDRYTAAPEETLWQIIFDTLGSPEYRVC